MTGPAAKLSFLVPLQTSFLVLVHWVTPQQRELQGVLGSASLVKFCLTKDTEWVKFVRKGKTMAIDFDALDLVRGENKARSYNKKVDELQQQVTSLQELVKEVVSALPKEKQRYYEEKIKTYLK